MKKIKMILVLLLMSVLTFGQYYGRNTYTTTVGSTTYRTTVSGNNVNIQTIENKCNPVTALPSTDEGILKYLEQKKIEDERTLNRLKDEIKLFDKHIKNKVQYKGYSKAWLKSVRNKKMFEYGEIQTHIQYLNEKIKSYKKN